MNKALLTGLTVILISACQSPYTDPEYKHQTINFTTPYTDWKKDRKAAEKTANKELDSYAKSECRRLALGWYLKKIESRGTLSCEDSDQGTHCKHNDASFLCEQLDESSRQ